MKQDTAVSKIQTGEIEEYDDFLLQATSKPPSTNVSDVSVPSLQFKLHLLQLQIQALEFHTITAPSTCLLPHNLQWLHFLHILCILLIQDLFTI
jgi:hypothetical protein